MNPKDKSQHWDFAGASKKFKQLFCTVRNQGRRSLKQTKYEVKEPSSYPWNIHPIFYPLFSSCSCIFIAFPTIGDKASKRKKINLNPPAQCFHELNYKTMNGRVVSFCVERMVVEKKKHQTKRRIIKKQKSTRFSPKPWTRRPVNWITLTHLESNFWCRFQPTNTATHPPRFYSIQITAVREHTVALPDPFCRR